MEPTQEIKEMWEAIKTIPEDSPSYNEAIEEAYAIERYILSQQKIL